MRATRLAAADACSLTSAKVAQHEPSVLGHSVDANDGRHCLVVLNTRLRDPNCAHDVRPAAVISCLECTSFLVAQAARWRRQLRVASLAVGAGVAQPSARGNFFDAVAHLVHRHVAPIAYDDKIIVMRVVVLTHSANGFVNGHVLSVGVQAPDTEALAAAVPPPPATPPIES